MDLLVRFGMYGPSYHIKPRRVNNAEKFDMNRHSMSAIKPLYRMFQ